ncbi:MAG TPA: hypothetical protein VJ378_01155, partial [Candidatus Paceibacterota bacterium]|nr:hypothetical protein [Candidatus Paceibacterota bacterium]
MKNGSKYISLKEAAKISGYTSDYIGYLIRKGKLKGKKTYSQAVWFTTKEAIEEYNKKNKDQQKKEGKPVKRPNFFQNKISNWLKILHLFLRVFKRGTVFLTLGIISLVGIYYIINFFNLPVEAGVQIKIFPTSYFSNWQNTETVLSQDLDKDAALEEFNKENSTHPSEILETLQTEEILSVPSDESSSTEETMPEEESSLETPQEEILPEESSEGTDDEELPEETIQPEDQEESSEPISIWHSIKRFFQAIAWAQEESQQPDLETEQETTTEDVFSEEIPEEELPEETIEQSLEQKAGSEELFEVIQESEESVGENTGVEGEKISFSNSLELSNFSVPEDLKGNEINNAQIRMSLAGKGNVGDKLIIDYYSQDSWQNLAEFNLENEISNNLNGGYFLYALPIFENWEDLEELQIKFTYQQKEKSDAQQVFIDAVWLELEYKEPDEDFDLELISGKKDFTGNEEPEFRIVSKKNKVPENVIEKLIDKTSSFF